MGPGVPEWCPVYRPSKEDFSKPFGVYINSILSASPDLAMFKVVPPRGWRARRTPFPRLDTITITVPIKQHVFGTKGSYRCLLVEQKPMTATEFKELAESNTYRPGKSDRHGSDGSDALMERAFWSSVTINPPLYGADTPISFFDDELNYGWNLRNLGDLLKKHKVPTIAGVTTPMTYFGMWKSFFSWHVEDADLMSINYLHFGAPKVWYCVSPKDRAKFERMTQSIFPDLYRQCPAFLRHKDILLSPMLLKTYGVQFVQAKQEPGEFIVLNAAAYHAGFNLGFNCAEAVNFATEGWLPIGQKCVLCECNVLRDGVHIDMSIFTANDEAGSGHKVPGEASGTRRSRVAGRHQQSSGGRKREGVQQAVVGRRGKQRQVETQGDDGVKGQSDQAGTRARKMDALSGAPHSPAPLPPNKRRKLLCNISPPEGKVTVESAPCCDVRNDSAGKDEEELIVSDSEGEDQDRTMGTAGGCGRGHIEDLVRTAWQVEDQGANKYSPQDSRPLAVVGVDRKGQKFFCLCQELKDHRGSQQGMSVLRWLREGKDGLYRPSQTIWEEKTGALLSVRTQWVEGSGSKGGGYKLLTLKSRLLGTEFID